MGKLADKLFNRSYKKKLFVAFLALIAFGLMGLYSFYSIKHEKRNEEQQHNHVNIEHNN